MSTISEATLLRDTSVPLNSDDMLRAALQRVGLMQHIDLSVRRYLDNGSLVRTLIDFLLEKREAWPASAKR